ncbi:MAG: hypothetical protein CMN96_04320 [Synechococcus sp. MED850]|nr:hypothetical protein [Synechococcus sp. MED850]OUW98473.1 MAG: hypothetical protein CBD89_03040 [Cyanobacteria bacterium TMED229]
MEIITSCSLAEDVINIWIIIQFTCVAKRLICSHGQYQKQHPSTSRIAIKQIKKSLLKVSCLA